MSNRSLFLLGATIGGLIGAYVPSLWGAGDFSGWSILFSTLGGLGGIWLAWRYVHG